MRRRDFLPVLAAAPTSATPPNVVLILTDDLGSADLGCYGSREISTPRCDRLASQGVRFTQAYSNAPVCSPTRAALMTGRYQQRVGIEYVFYGERTKGKGLSSAASTLPSLLKRAGYRTGMVGKWHLGDDLAYGPNRHGFDEFYGFRGSDHDYYTHGTVFGTSDLWENERPVESAGYSTDLFAARGADFIRRSAGQPFFLYAAFNAPHWPFQPPGKPEDVRSKGNWEAGNRADYVRMVERLDEGIGQILGALDDAKAAGNTLVVFTNDNGGERLSDNMPFSRRKFTLWEGGIRVPAIVRWPGRVPAGRTCDQVAITMDWNATIRNAAGIAPGAGMPPDGIDLLPFLSGAKQPTERTLYWRTFRPNPQKAVRQGDWKLLQDGRSNLLFDLETDVGEQHDLAMQDPKRVEAMQALLGQWEQEMAESKPPYLIQ